MSDDPYTVLGVSKDATHDDIRSAYRKLVKELHPDVKPGDKAAEERFKKVAEAYAILGDEKKRAQFDRGEIDASGRETQREFYHHYADAGGNPYESSAGFEDLGDIFADLFGSRAQPGGERSYRVRMPGRDLRYTMSVEFLEAVNGAKRRVTMPDGKTLDVTIPKGLRDGQVLRLKGHGEPGFGGGPAGDAYIETEVRPHRFFARDGNNIRLALPVTLDEAVLGAKVQVPTVGGPVTMTIPPHSNTGTVLRLKGKGVPKADGSAGGDQLVELRITLPADADSALDDFAREWRKTHKSDVRSGLGV